MLLQILKHHVGHKTRNFYTNPITQVRKPLKVSYPSLRKHLQPDILTGPERRSSLVKKARLIRHIPTPIRKKTRGFVPSKFKLGPIASDVGSEPKTGNYNYRTRKASLKPGTLSINDFEKRTHNVRFEDMSLLPSIFDSIIDLFKENKGPLKPTEIQALAIPEILKQKVEHILLAAETGSGKTLAYLVPIINFIKKDELDFKSNNQLFQTIQKRQNRPRAVVLVPSCQLVQQAHEVAKRLSHVAKFRVTCLTRNTKRKDLLRKLAKPIDLVIATPASLKRYLQDMTLSMSEVQYLAIDEADTLFDEGFGPDVEELITLVKKITTNKNLPMKVMIVSATLPKKLILSLEVKFPNMLKITTPSLHKALPNCTQHFVDLKSYKGNRFLALVDVISQYEARKSASPLAKESDRTMIFCNTIQALFLLKKHLLSKNINCLCLFGRTKPDAEVIPATEEQLRQFMKPKLQLNTSNGIDDSVDSQEQLEQSLEPKILLCTDIASRGIDSINVKHVILYDFPTSIVDYLHRIGRTARNGHSGVVTSLVGRRDRNLAERIRRSVRSKTVLS